MKTTKRSLFLIFAAAIALSSCTQKKTASEIVVAMPPMQIEKMTDVHAMTHLELGHLVINVTGPDMQPIFFSWDAHNHGENTPAPSSFVLDVPKGDSRFFQVLAIYQPLGADGDSNMSFYYDDVTKSIVNDTESIAMTVELISTGTTSATGSAGHIIGRYINGAETPYTGPIRYMYKPPTAPAMVVHRGEMFKGWFEVFALQGSTKFTYVRGDGHVMFGGPVGADSASILQPIADEESTVRFLYPSAYRSKWVDGQPVGRRFEEAQRVVVGFFGNGTSKRVCYPQSGTIRDFYQTSSSTTEYTWNGLSGPGPTQAGPETAVTADASSVKGGYMYSTNPAECTGNEFIDKFYWNPTDPWQGAGFRGPFVLQQLGTSTYKQEIAAEFIPFGNTLNLSWQYLPGVAGVGNAITSTDIFIRIGGTENYRDPNSDGYLCGQGLIDRGFIKLPSVAANDGPNSTAISLTATQASAWNQGNLKVIACPYSSGTGKYFLSAVEARSGGGGGSQFSLTWQNSDLNFGVNTCNPMIVEIKKQNAAFTMPAGTSVNVNLSTNGDSNTSFYSSNACSVGTQISTATIAAGTSTTTVYVQRTAGGISELQANATGLPNNIWIQEARRSLAFVDSGSPTRVNLNFQNAMVNNKCYQVHIVLTDNNNVPRNSGGGINVNLTSSVPGSFYSDATCTTGASPPWSFGIGTAAAMTYFKPTGTGWSSGAMTSSSGLSEASQNFASDDEVVSEYRIVGWNNGPSNDLTFENAGDCVEVRVKATNLAGAQVNVSSSKTIALTVSGGGLYANNTCTTALSPASKTISMYWSESDMFWFKPATTANVTLTASDGVLSPTTTVASLVPPHHLEFLSPSTYIVGLCNPIGLALRKQDNSSYTATYAHVVDLSYNGQTGGYYSDANCTTPITDITFAVGESTKSLYAIVSGASGSWNLVATHNTYPNIGGQKGMNSVALHSFNFNKIGGTGCAVFDIRTYDGTSPVGYPNPIDVRVEVTSAGTDIKLYSDSGCTTPAGSDIGGGIWQADTTIISGGVFSRFYMKATAGASYTATAMSRNTTTSTGYFTPVFNAVSGHSTGSHAP